MGIDLKKALEVATKSARAAGELIRAEFHRDGGPRHSGKHHADVDHEAEVLIRKRLLESFPESGYVGEETGTGAPSRNGATWFVDPNDGTKSFIAGWRGSAVSIALVSGGVPVLGVVFAPVAPDDTGDLITWAEGQPLRRNGTVVERVPLPERLDAGTLVLVSQDADRNPEANAAVCAPARFRAVPSIAYRLALVAVGEGDAGVSLNGPVAWDYAGGHALLRAVGGDLVDEQGRPVRYDGARGGGRWFFGGQLECAKNLARRPWSGVLERAPVAAGIAAAYPLVRPSHAAKIADPGIVARAQGCLLGQVAGDALGQLVEFRSARDIRREYPDGVRELRDGGTWNTIAGQPTDDSEMALVLARSIVKQGSFSPESAREAYVAWKMSGPFDIGGTTSAGLSGRPNRESQANGSLMRISTAAIFGSTFEPDDLAELAAQDSAITHPNEVCRDATRAFAVAVGTAIRTGASPREVYSATMRWARDAELATSVVEALERADGEAPADFGRQQGWVLIALQNAFYQLVHAPTLESGVVDTVGRGGDSDTNAAIAGALLGAVHGRDAVPLRWRRAVLSCRPLRTERARPQTFWPVDALELAERLLCLGARVAKRREEAERAKIVRLDRIDERDEAYQRAVATVVEKLCRAREMLFAATLQLAMKKAWRAWDREQPVGTVAEFSTEQLLEAVDPNVREAAKAVAAVEQAAWNLGYRPG